MSEIPEVPDDPVDQILVRAADMLSEHFESVRIFCSTARGEETVSVSIGRGNTMAQRGQVEEWMEAQRQYSRNAAIRRDSEGV